MKHLYLIRHARAKRADVDHERPLSGRGQRQVAAMAEPLQRLGAFTGEIHVSTALRARQTLLGLDATLPELGLAGRAHYHEALYTFEEKPLRRWLRAADLDTDHLTLLGHNPALLALAQRLSAHEAPTHRRPVAYHPAHRHLARAGPSPGRDYPHSLAQGREPHPLPGQGAGATAAR